MSRNAGGVRGQIQSPLELLDRLAARLPPPAFTATVTSACDAERPLTRNFHSDPERQELAEHGGSRYPIERPLRFLLRSAARQRTL